MRLEQLAAELERVQRQHAAALQDAGRLEARLAAAALSAQSDRDAAAAELQRRDDAIARLKADITDQAETIEKQGDTVRVPEE